MFKFGFPENLYLLLLLPVHLLFTFLALRKRKKLLNAFGSNQLVKRLMRSVNPQRRIMKALFPILGLFFLILAMARPQFGTRVETVKREGQDLIVALDVSVSMMAQDIRPSRLEKAKLEISSMLDRLQGDRIGLVAFAGDAFLQCPLTLDYGAAKMFLSAIGPDIVSLPGTSIANAVETSLKAFKEEEKTNKVLILITDGEDHTGRIPEVAEAAAEKGVIIHTIGIGTREGVPIPLQDSGQGFKKDRKGEVVLTRLDESVLAQLSEKTGGEYFLASANEQELNAIFRSIAEMDKKELSAKEVTIFDEKFQIFLAIGLILILVEFLIFESRKSISSWKGRFE
jgi:Ca-activated chloride channel family protein